MSGNLLDKATLIILQDDQGLRAGSKFTAGLFLSIISIHTGLGLGLYK